MLTGPGVRASQEWFSPAELAGLPGMPGTSRRVRDIAKQRRWTARPRKGRGGGWQYHLANLPAETRAALLLRGEVRPEQVTDVEQGHRAALWEDWERKPEGVRAEAARRLSAVAAVERLIFQRVAKLEACRAVAAEIGQSISTVRNWMRLVKGAHKGDYLPLLAPRWTGRTAFLEYDEEVYVLFRDLYLASSRPAASVCYDRVRRIAQERGLNKVPSKHTLMRELERREDPVVVVMEREGEQKAAEMYPYLQRSRAEFYAMEAVNVDGHVLDIDTIWPDGERCRTTFIGFQDLYSGALVHWRLAKAESAHELGLAFLGLCDQLGVPEHLWVDNTLAMASKRLTAGARGRRRFRDSPGDPIGVLPLLGVQVHFTQVARGQSKPIERSFCDLANWISKHPAFAGAYLGNNPLNRPADYGTRTVTLAELERVVSQEVLAHNQRPGRRTEVCRNKLSFWQAFEHSYATNRERVRRLTDSQRRLLYLVAETQTIDRRDGCVRVFGNRYWTEELLRLRGTKVVVRYHPERLHDAVWVYALNGDFITEVPVYEKAGFADAAAGHAHNRARRQFLSTKKKLRAAARRLEAVEIASMVPELEPPELSAVASDGVVRIDFSIPSTPERLATVPGGITAPAQTVEESELAALREWEERDAKSRMKRLRRLGS